MAAAIDRLSRRPFYGDLFGAAFGDRAITEDRMQRALAEFLRAMVSTDSRWDTAFAQVFDPSLPDKGVNKPLPGFTDVRELQRQLKAKGVELQQQADESTTGPASFIAVDPDGNPILVDQHR
jgi:hypothetical protein